MTDGIRQPADPTEGAVAPLRARIVGLPPSVQTMFVAKAIVSRLQSALGEGDVSIDPETGFLAMGVDSRMAVELKELLEADLGLTLGTTLLFDQPNVRQLAEYLVARVSQAGGRPD